MLQFAVNLEFVKRNFRTNGVTTTAVRIKLSRASAGMIHDKQVQLTARSCMISSNALLAIDPHRQTVHVSPHRKDKGFVSISAGCWMPIAGTTV
jgi:hypothetical protein